MKRVMLFVALMLAISAGCRKTYDKPEPAAGGNQGGGGFGAEQAVRGRVNQIVTEHELKSLHTFMYYAYAPSGRVPTSQETLAAISQPTGDPKLVGFIKDGLIVLVPNPTPEGLWAYVKEAPVQGGFVVTQQGVERKTAQDVNRLLQGG